MRLDAPVVPVVRRAQHDGDGQWVPDDEIPFERDVDDHVPLVPRVDVDLLRHHQVAGDLELRAMLAGRESDLEILARVERQLADAVDEELAAHRRAVRDVDDTGLRRRRDDDVGAARDEPFARLLDDAVLGIADDDVAVTHRNGEGLAVPLADGADVVAVHVDGDATARAVLDGEERGAAVGRFVMRCRLRCGNDEGKGEGAGYNAQHGGLLFVNHRRRLTVNHFDHRVRRTYLDGRGYGAVRSESGAPWAWRSQSSSSSCSWSARSPAPRWRSSPCRARGSPSSSRRGADPRSGSSTCATTTRSSFRRSRSRSASSRRPRP